jgi:hypothetical protein
VLHVSEIPDDRTYRNAWTYEEGWKCQSELM